MDEDLKKWDVEQEPEEHKYVETEPVRLVAIARAAVLLVVSILAAIGYNVDESVFEPIFENLEIFLIAILAIGGVEQWLTSKFIRKRVWAPATVEDRGWLDPPEDDSTEEPDDGS